MPKSEQALALRDQDPEMSLTEISQAIGAPTSSVCRWLQGDRLGQRGRPRGLTAGSLRLAAQADAMRPMAWRQIAKALGLRDHARLYKSWRRWQKLSNSAKSGDE